MMKNSLGKFMLLFFSAAGAFAFILPGPKKKTAKITVTGVVYTHGTFCGGMRLPPDEWEKITKEKPVGNQVFYIRSGDTNTFGAPVVTEVKTDNEGKFSVQLLPGTYCFVDSFKLNRKNYEKILADHSQPTQYYEAADTACLRAFFGKPDLVFTVKASKNDPLRVDYYQHCSWYIPCVSFNGPLPP